MSLAKRNPHFLPFLKGLAVKFRNADTQKKIASGKGRKTKLGERWKRGRKSYEAKRGIWDTPSFMCGKATGPGKRRQSWYIAGNMQATLISVKKESMEGMKEQVSMQTMWIHEALMVQGALEWCKEPISQMLFSLFYDFQYHDFKNKHSQHEHTLQQTLPHLNIHGAWHFFTSISQSH